MQSDTMASAASPLSGARPAGLRTPAQERAAALEHLTWPDRCAGCGAVPDPPLRCAGCRALVYCSPGCQRADWAEHKSRCEYLRGLEFFSTYEDAALREPDQDYQLHSRARVPAAGERPSAAAAEVTFFQTRKAS
jgi:hypothetical protein